MSILISTTASTEFTERRINMANIIIEIGGKKYRRHYYNSCVRCALSPERTGTACPVADCEDGTYYKEVKEKTED